MGEITLKDPACVGNVSLYMQKHFNNLVGRSLRMGSFASYGLKVDTTRDGMLLLTAMLDLPNSGRSLMVKETIQHPLNAHRLEYRWKRPVTNKEKVAARLGVEKRKTESVIMSGYNESTLHSIVQKLFDELKKAYENDVIQNPAAIQTPIRNHRLLA